ncbi:unnamed protein product [Pieris macdunnoughi]|uniref:Uncharacterized protein n=1 Tax=Pieris macdunnoughi TaxID=345717 RepID=A0A821LCJ5_9NEOP|nr:unnamed protein product [Pieris macdunnoughi]
MELHNSHCSKLTLDINAQQIGMCVCSVVSLVLFDQVRYVGLYRPGKQPGGAMRPPPDFIFSGEYMAHDPHGSSSNFNTLEGEWYCRSKILATLSYFGVENGDASPRPLATPGDNRLSRVPRDVTLL